MAVCTVHYPKRSLVARLGPALTVLAVIAIVALAAVLRFWHLGIRTFQGDETVNSLIANQLARGGGYEHLPVLHGPLHYFATAAAFHVLGTTDLAARAMPALTGVLLAAMPFLFARHIGRIGAIAASLLLAVSPTLLYESRFAGPDIYLALTSLAMAMLIWRYLASPDRAYLYLLAGALALAIVTTEMALVVAAVFAAYLAYLTGRDFVAQARAPRPDMLGTHYELLGVAEDATVREIRAAYKQVLARSGRGVALEALGGALHVLTTANRRQSYDRRLAQRRIAAEGAPSAAGPGVGTQAILMIAAAPIAALWPFLSGVRRRLGVSRLPDAAHPLLVIVLLMLPFYGPLVEKLPFVGDRGFAGQQPVLVLGGGTTGTPGGELPVMLITLGALFALAAVIGLAWRWPVFVICWAIFYGVTITLFTGFFTNKGGVWTGLWGTLDYWWRPEAHHVNAPSYEYAMTLPAYEIAPIAIVLVAFAWMLLFGTMRNRIALAIGLSALAAVIAAPAWLQPIAAHRTLLALIAACGTALAMRLPPLTKFLAFWCVAAFFAFTMLGRKDAALAVHIALPLCLLAGKLANDAVAAFEMPVLPAALPSLRTAAPRRVAQGFAIAGFVAVAIFTARTGVLATWGHGSVPQLSDSLVSSDHGDTPIELLHSDDVAPDVREVRAAIARAGAESGQGTNIPIALDTSYDFAKGWLWYLRDYPNLTIEDMRHGYQVPAGAIALFDSRNRAKIQVDGASQSLVYTQSWSFPDANHEASGGEIASDLTSARWWSDWSRYLIDRTRAGQPWAVQGVVYFPRELSAALPTSLQSDVLSAAVEPQPRAPATAP